MELEFNFEFILLLVLEIKLTDLGLSSSFLGEDPLFFRIEFNFFAGVDAV